MTGIWTAFQPREGGIWTKIFQKFKCPGGCPGGMFKLRFDWYINNCFCTEKIWRVSRHDLPRFWQFLSQNDHFAKPIALPLGPILAIFKNMSFLEYEVFFVAVFSTKQLWPVSRDVFGMLFAILIFEPNWPFCKAYSFCVLANFDVFQKLVISTIIGAFWSRFFHRTTLTCPQRRFWPVFGSFNFWAKLTILQSL